MNRDALNRVRIAPHRAIVWDEDLELCPDALYMELAGDLELNTVRLMATYSDSLSMLSFPPFCLSSI